MQLHRHDKTLVVNDLEPIDLKHTKKYEVWTTLTNRALVLLVTKDESQIPSQSDIEALREIAMGAEVEERRPLPPSLDMSWKWNKTERRWERGTSTNSNSQGNAAVAQEVSPNTNEEENKPQV